MGMNKLKFKNTIVTVFITAALFSSGCAKHSKITRQIPCPDGSKTASGLDSIEVTCDIVTNKKKVTKRHGSISSTTEACYEELMAKQQAECLPATDDHGPDQTGNSPVDQNAASSISAADLLVSDSRSNANDEGPGAGKDNAPAESNAIDGGYLADKSSDGQGPTGSDALGGDVPVFADTKKDEGDLSGAKTEGEGSGALAEAKGGEESLIDKMLKAFKDDKSKVGGGYASTGSGGGGGSGANRFGNGVDVSGGGNGLSSQSFSRDPASAGLSAGDLESLDDYLARVGMLSLFERVHPIYGKWDRKGISERAQMDFHRAKIR